MELIIDAVERRLRELLNQAANYERLGMQSIADETMDLHYRPLQRQLEALRGAN